MRTPKNVLITGGCGFIGSALIRYLFRQDDFTGNLINLDSLTYAANPENVAGAVDEARYKLEMCDILDQRRVEELCKANDVDTIIHLAAESHVDRSIHGPGAFIQTNVVGTFKLLEVVRALPHMHFHHVSTDEVYGSLGDTGLFLETTPYSPNSPYSASKASSDHLVRAYAHTYGLSTTLSNCSNNYGPYQFPEKFLPLMVLNMVEAKPLPVYGDGSNVRDWLFVDDHAEALWLIVKSGAKGETYNIGGENEWTNIKLLHKLMEVVAELAGKDVEQLKSLITYVKDRPGHDKRYAIDCTKIKKELGWTIRHDLEQGLRDTVQWYLDNPEWIAHIRSGEYREWMDKNYGQR